MEFTADHDRRQQNPLPLGAQDQFITITIRDSFVVKILMQFERRSWSQFTAYGSASRCLPLVAKKKSSLFGAIWSLLQVANDVGKNRSQ